MSFYTWITSYNDDSLMIRHFAKIMKIDKNFPKDVLSKDAIIHYLYNNNAGDRALLSFERAWKKYEEEVVNENK